MNFHPDKQLFQVASDGDCTIRVAKGEASDPHVFTTQFYCSAKANSSHAPIKITGEKAPLHPIKGSKLF